MNRETYCDLLATYNEHEYDAKKDLEDIKFKIMMEDDPDRKQWFIDAQARVEERIEEIAREIANLHAEYESASGD